MFDIKIIYEIKEIQGKEIANFYSPLNHLIIFYLLYKLFKISK
jgi:hypothetical protein